jgi:hypothetical protein
MIQQYILLAIGGAVILLLLFGFIRRNVKDFISVLFDLPEESDSEKYEKGEIHE